MIWYLIHRRSLRPPAEMMPRLDEHLAWMRERHEAGTVLFSGPSTDGKLGIYVVRAASRAAAEDVARHDPLTAAGLCDFEVFEWRVDQVLGVGPFTAAQVKALAEG